MDAEFWQMGGYARYVWGSYLLTALALAWNLWLPRRQRRNLLSALRQPEDAA